MRLKDGRYVLLHDPVAGRPSLMEAAAFGALWDGTLILFARRAALSDLGRRFDIGDT